MWAKCQDEGQPYMAGVAANFKEWGDQIHVHVHVGSPAAEIPVSSEKITQALLEREVRMPTYLGSGMAIPHARLEELRKPLLVFARSDEGIPIRGRGDKARLLFILLSPTDIPRIQARLLAHIGGLMDSEYMEELLLEAKSPQAILETIKAGDPAALS